MNTIRVGNILRGKVTEIMSDWLRSDCFGRQVVNAPREKKRGPDSVREFISWVYSLHARGRIELGADGTSAFPEFDASLSDLLGVLYRPAGCSRDPLPLSGLMAGSMMLACARGLLSEASTYQPCYPETERHVDAMVAECGAKDFREMHAALDDAFGEELAVCMLDATVTGVGDRPLRSFFIRDKTGFGRWWPGATTDLGRALPDHTISTDFGRLVVSVRRYDDEGEGIPVRAYEWVGRLGDDDQAEPEAVCVGMAYVFERDWGSPIGNLNSLVYASDLVSDADVLQVKAFLQQHDDCQDVIEDSDLGFVWIWERNPQGRKGAGQACLQASVADLRRRFRSLRTVIIEATPYHFQPLTDVVEPSPIQEARLEALDKLQAYISQLDFGRSVEVRTIVDRDDGSVQAAQSFLGAVGLREFLARGGDPSELMTMDEVAAAFRGDPPTGKPATQ